MNKKSAFTVVVQLLKKMELETVNRSINVMLVANSFLEESGSYLMNYGLNTKMASKHIHNYLSSTIARSVPYKEK